MSAYTPRQCERIVQAINETNSIIVNLKKKINNEGNADLLVVYEAHKNKLIAMLSADVVTVFMAE